MDSELRALMRNGIEVLKQGKHNSAYPFFLQALKSHPQYVPAHVYAGASAPTQAKAAAHLKAAKAIDPEHPALRKGQILVEKRSWGEDTRPEAHSRSWITRALRPGSTGQPNWWVIGGSTLLLVSIVVAGFIALIMGTFYYLNVLRPAGESQAVVFPTELPSVTKIVFQPSTDPSKTPTAPVGQTKTQPPASTRRPSRTITVTKTATLPPPTSTVYPKVSYFSFVGGNERYAGQGLRLTGQVVDFGEAMLDGEIAFALLLGPPPGEADEDEVFAPVVVLGIAPDARFALDTVLTIAGIGADKMDDLIVQGLRWEGAVLLGEGVLEMEKQ